MYKKLIIKYVKHILNALLIFLVILVLVNCKNRSFRSKITDVDTSRINSISIFPDKKALQPIELYRFEGHWNVKCGNKKYKADNEMVTKILETIYNMTPEQIVSTKKEDWKKYKLDDSTATRIMIKSGERREDDIYIGNISYKVPNEVQKYYGNGQQGNLTTYVRVQDDNNVYLTDGFLALTFSPNVNDYRIKLLFPKVDKDWTKLTFSYPSDSSFILSKETGKWMLNGRVADSLAIMRYISSIAGLTCSVFRDEFTAKDNQVMELKIDGKPGTGSIQIQAYKPDSTCVIASDYNQGAYFDATKSGIFSKIFVSGNQFLPKKKKTK